MRVSEINSFQIHRSAIPEVFNTKNNTPTTFPKLIYIVIARKMDYFCIQYIQADLRALQLVEYLR